MDRLIKEANKGNLRSALRNDPEEKYKQTAMNSEIENIREEENSQETDPDYRNLEIENPNELELDISEIIPTKRIKKSINSLEVISTTRIKNRVNTFEKLSNGVTPYEIMYGTQDDDFACLNRSDE
jgi:hypothetical protein